MRNVLMGAAAAALLAGSTVAHAAPAPRAASPVAKSDALHGGELWLAILAAGLLVFILFQINEKDKDVLPHSP